MLAKAGLAGFLWNLGQSPSIALPGKPTCHARAFPQTAVLDNFNRANATELGSDWTAFGQSGSAADGGIVSNQAYNPDGGDGWNYFYWAAGTVGPDCEAYITSTTFDFNDGVQVFARLQDVTVDEFGFSGYMASMDKFGSGVQLNRVAPFNQTLLGSDDTISPANGDSIGIRCCGNHISAWHKPAAGKWTKIVEVVDGEYEAAGYIGWYLSVETSWRYDNFGGGNL